MKLKINKNAKWVMGLQMYIFLTKCKMLIL